MRLVYKVSTCLALRRKSHLKVNKICVPKYFCHPVDPNEFHLYDAERLIRSLLFCLLARGRN